MEQLSKEEQFLSWEYQNATQLTYHIDELRNKLTSFWLTFVGAALAGIALLIKRNEVKEIFETNFYLIIDALFFIVGLIGVFIICILGRLRKSQIEHFSIINNIRSHFLKEGYNYWNIVQLSKQTLPKPNRKSGTYFWILIIIVSCGLLFAGIIMLIPDQPIKWWNQVKIGISMITFFISVVCLDRLYLTMAKSDNPITYSEENKPK